MQTIKLYLYPNLVEVQMVDASIFTVRNRDVYSRPVTVYQGIDNPLQLVIKNQEQKRIDMTGYGLQADIQDPTNQVTIDSVGVTWIDQTKGIAKVIIPRELVNRLEQRYYKLTFKSITVATSEERPVYIDDNYGVPLDLQILPAYEARTAPTPDVTNIVIDGGFINEQ